jgi:endonuclease/exonuclease/phosphatase family metal-dependent hydrolase
MLIRLATLNAWAIPEPIGRNVLARMDAIGEKLPDLDLDVIAFQEVWTSDAALRLQRAGQRAGLEHCWFGDDTFGDGGLLVLSRLPIEEVRFEPFLVKGEPERVAMNLEYVSGKGFATVRLATPAGPFLLVDTHLHARYTSSTPHKYAPHRTGQAVQMTTRLIESDLPMAAVGDFNMREGEPDYRVLTDILGLTDVAVALDSRQNTTLHASPYRAPAGLDRRKDYVFVRSGASRKFVPEAISRSFDEILEIDGQPGGYSNHAGLIADLQLTPTSATAAAQLRAADPSVFDLAERLLAEGESLSIAHQSGGRQISGIGIGLGAAATAAALREGVSRRRFLRAGLATAALLAVTPGVGFSIMSEVLMPDQIRAFRQAAQQLASLRPDRSVALSS